MNESSPQVSGERVEARAAADPAVRLFILAAMLLGYSIWCLLDWREPPPAWTTEHINEIGPYLSTNVAFFLALPGGLVPLVWGFVFLRRRLVADAEGIGYLGKDQVPWHAIEKVDASKLPSKGILDLYHGEDKKLRLDSWKLKNFKPLVAFVEAHLPAKVLEESGMAAQQADESPEAEPDAAAEAEEKSD